MRLKQAEQNMFHFRKSRKFGFRLILLAAIERCSACFNLWALVVTLKKNVKIDNGYISI